MCVTHGGRSEYEAVKKLFETITLDELQGNCLVAIGRVQDPELVKECFNYALNDGYVRSQDLFRIIGCLTDGLRSKLVWECIVEHWTTICTKFQGGKYLFGKIITAPLNSMYDRNSVNNAKAFLDSKSESVNDIKRTIDQALEQVMNSIEWVERDNTNVVSFFESH